jgi:hypothetical protein
MGICKDQSTTYLKKLGYNVVRHPQAAIAPLGLIGRQNKTTTYLGPLNLLVTNPPGPLPAIMPDIPAADINGQTSSKLDIGIGLNILGSFIGAMGGNLGINAGYTNAQKVTFVFSDVLNDQVVPLAVGNYLREANVDSENLVLKQYVLGNGSLYLITMIAKSKKFEVKYERSDGTDAAVNVPVVQQMIGGNVKVSLAAGTQATLAYEGTTPLVFGFKAFEVGVEDGVLSLVSAQPGALALAVAFDGTGHTDNGLAAQLTESGLLDLELAF